MTTTVEQAATLLVQGLKNTHALESQAKTVMGQQISSLDEFPELRARLEAHLEETETQLSRLEAALERHNATPSSILDASMQFMGSSQAFVQMMGPNKGMRTMIADQGVEGFEIAAYLGLIALARHADDDATVAALEQSLAEERAMFNWLADNMPTVVAQSLTVNK